MEGVLWGLGCALSWSIANLSIGKAARRFGEVGALAQSQILGALAMIPARAMTISLDMMPPRLRPRVGERSGRTLEQISPEHKGRLRDRHLEDEVKDLRGRLEVVEKKRASG